MDSLQRSFNCLVFALLVSLGVALGVLEANVAFALDFAGLTIRLCRRLKGTGHGHDVALMCGFQARLQCTTRPPAVCPAVPPAVCPAVAQRLTQSGSVPW